MLKRAAVLSAVGVLLTSTTAFLATDIGTPIPAVAHEDHGHFSAGQPGDPKKPARTIKVVMREEDEKKMAFEPARITVRKGEQIRFVLENAGIEDHEFVLASAEENRKHAELMKKFPDMEHDDPNARRLAPAAHGEILWKFTEAGTFEFACLIPGHREAGMHGKVVVK
jgi:uncharacterized cupredoxin-like copper-binding protein